MPKKECIICRHPITKGQQVSVYRTHPVASRTWQVHKACKIRVDLQIAEEEAEEKMGTAEVESATTKV